MLSYEKYVGLLSKQITATTMPSAKISMTAKDYEQIKEFETAQPAICPHCKRNVRTFSEPFRIVHDIEACGKATNTPAKKHRFDEN